MWRRLGIGANAVEQPPAPAPQTSREQLRSSIAGKGIGKEFLDFLEQHYTLESVLDELRTVSPQQLAQNVGWTGEIGGKSKQQVPTHQGKQHQNKQHQNKQHQGKQQTDTRGDPETWSGRFIGELFLTTLALLLWLANGASTVFACAMATPFTVIGAILGLPAHYGITRVELNLWHRWRDPAYAIPLVICSAIDIGSALYALTAFCTRVLPWLAGEAPLGWWTWPAAVLSPVIQRLLAARADSPVDPATLPPIPSWWWNTIILTALAFAIAIGSERWLKKYWSNLKTTWREKYPARVATA